MIDHEQAAAAEVAELRRRAAVAAKLHRDHEAAKLAHKARELNDRLARMRGWAGRGAW